MKAANRGSSGGMWYAYRTLIILKYICLYDDSGGGDEKECVKKLFGIEGRKLTNRDPGKGVVGEG